MSADLATSATILDVRCAHCGSAMLVHDGTVGEITCQLCARVWECDPGERGHEECAHHSELRRIPAFPGGTNCR